ncbi:AGAP009803-PA-like protein [Anopheles sinensis]|uniref:AGAP009803-PA-like protein n=1 Tax=Anopheles sinensis TaxID=74873 RepID=A0A084WG57_ANOSI|nr:AGAP009803-PA-like protein [Anopheles sinensis]
MSTYYRNHSWILKLASFVYFTPCSFNEKTGAFEETRWNLAMFGVGTSLAIPFWYSNIYLTTTKVLQSYSSVLAAVGGIELVIYASVVISAILNAFVNRKRITVLMNVLFRTDWLLDSFGGSTRDLYSDSHLFLAIISCMAFSFSFKFVYHKDIPTKFLSVLILARLFAVFLVAFVHRLFVNAIALRMKQLRMLYDSGLMKQDAHLFVERFGRYQREIEQVDRCLSFPILQLFLLSTVQLLYLLDEWYTIFEYAFLKTSSILDQYWIVRQMWQCLYGVLTYVTVSACGKASKQVEETALCTRHFDDYRLQNTRAAKQINKFLLKNLHQKKKFSACGFFDIDNTVIYMVGLKISGMRQMILYNEQTDQFEETVRNRLTFLVNLLMAVPFWFIDVKLMTVQYLHQLSVIMAIVGAFEIIVYVSIVTCTLLNSFFRRRRFTRMMNVLFRSDWLLDRYDRKEQQYDNGRQFGITMIAVLTMLCCNVSYHEDVETRLLSLTVSIKILGCCYLCFIHRICTGAIGVRMEQLAELFAESQKCRAGREQMLSAFVDRYELYAAQVGQINRCFSFPLTLMVLLVVIEMVYLMFDCFTVVQLQRPVLEGLDSGYTRWALRQLWQSIYMVLVLLIVSGTVRTTERLRETAVCVQHFDDYRYRNTRIAKQLQRFLLYNLERDTQFSVSGFFNIDYTMVQMVVSAIITHTLILIQFDQMQPADVAYANRINSTG